jgi:hypothetical protein
MEEEDLFSVTILDSIKIESIIKIEYDQVMLTSNFEILIKYLKGLGKGF